MEKVLLRFHQIGKKIFEELDNQSLIKCREVNESWRGSIDGEKTVPFRIIKSLTNVPDGYLDKTFGKVDLDSVIKLMKDIQDVYSVFHKVKQSFEIFFGDQKQRTYPRISNGLSNPNPVNPSIVFGMTALHHAAQNGYLNVCKLIAENVQEKNPKDFAGATPLQMADQRGHSSVVEYFQTLLNVVEEPRQKRRTQNES